MESSNVEVFGNTISEAEYGIRLSCGTSDNRVYENKVDNTSEGETHN